MKHIWIVLAACISCGRAAADFVVECTAGCTAVPPTERTPNLLLVADEQPDIELTWISTTAPAEGESFRLRAGNPMVQDNLNDLGALNLTANDARWSASRRFRVADLGHGTFIAATLSRRRSTESIADWRVFRVVRHSELDQQEQGAQVTGGLSVDLTPELLQVSTGHGELPSHTGGDERIWWPIPASYSGVDVDIDGENTGVPGITITHSAPWESRGSDWRREVLDHLPEVVGHFVDFDSPWFNESPDREINVGGDLGTVLVKHYYSAVTLFTNATATVLTAQDLGQRGNKRFFAHETTANFRQLADPRLWSSYSRREYSADPWLLTLIGKSIDSRGLVPGLGDVQQDDGDGGSAIYRVGFRARVAPWSVPDAQTAFRPGFVHVDVVAVRTGVGDVKTSGTAQTSGLCKLTDWIDCQRLAKVDLSKPPRGYEVAAPMAITGSQSGTLSMLQGVPLRAQREDLDPNGIDFPTTTRFALAAQLRAGALVRKRGLFNRAIEDVVPINSYAQYVLKYTVAMIPQTVIVASDEAVLPDASEFDTSTVVVPKKNWWEHLKGLLGWPGMIIVAVIALIVLAFFLPGAARLVNAIFRMFAALVDRITVRLRGKPTT
jgi:hypothetical protein